MKLALKMVKKTNILLFSLIAALVAGPAYSVTVSKTYVDRQDKTLQGNILLLRDMLNTKDSSGAWLTLDTEAKLAIPAINELKAALDSKANADDVLTADSLTELNQAVAALESGKATVADLEALQGTVDALGDTYATDAELTAAIDAVKLLIPTIPTKVSVFENDARYITDAALTDYAKSADVEMVANKLSDATAEQIEAMSSTDKATKYPSIAVSQTIANAAVTKVNEVAGDLSSLQTRVSTNTADIAELDKTVEKVSVVANAAIPAPTEVCKSASGACALSSDTEGNLTWVVIAGSLNNN